MLAEILNRKLQEPAESKHRAQIIYYSIWNIQNLCEYRFVSGTYNTEQVSKKNK